MLVAELTRLSNTSDEHSQKLQETYSQKVKSLETQVWYWHSNVYKDIFTRFPQNICLLLISDLWAKEKTGKSNSSPKTKTKEWRSSKAAAGGNPENQVSKGSFMNLVLAMIISYGPCWYKSVVPCGHSFSGALAKQNKAGVWAVSVMESFTREGSFAGTTYTLFFGHLD